MREEICGVQVRDDWKKVRYEGGKVSDEEGEVSEQCSGMREDGWGMREKSWGVEKERWGRCGEWEGREGWWMKELGWGRRGERLSVKGEGRGGKWAIDSDLDPDPLKYYGSGSAKWCGSFGSGSATLVIVQALGKGIMIGGKIWESGRGTLRDGLKLC